MVIKNQGLILHFSHIMPILHIVILALVQGITEFLPISSSGHLLLTHAVLDGSVSPDAWGGEFNSGSRGACWLAARGAALFQERCCEYAAWDSVAGAGRFIRSGRAVQCFPYCGIDPGFGRRIFAAPDPARFPALGRDRFCGTGALGLEALSQGAETCVFMDNARDSLALARENAAALKVGEEAQFILKDAAKLGVRPENILPRDLIFLDPPYRKNLIPQAIESLQNNNWLAENAFFVIEAEKGFAAEIPGLDIQDSRAYGETLLMLAIALSR